ncbi:hypothetical protein H072_10217 [Dactylellina haptotyla CBS 200.50]|uniref:Cytochrome b561 domain-containing protein n=1 Tax=Dactylellina haptotyla (strain CBS 200.50) TaxID=1284197 RepID=S7ZZV2_DACHA|nr:hypothetical protein H072_10217 [Dactylellina haptotyla CBS 200.50]
MKIRIIHQLILAFACQSLVSASPPGLHDKRSLQLRTAQPARAIHDGLASFSLSRREDGPDSAAAEGGHGGRRTLKTTPTQRRNFRIAHGTIMATAFTIGFPSGAIFLRVLTPPYHVYLHAFTQLLSTCMAFAGLGLGVWLGLNTRYLDYAHTIIGFAVVGSLVIQPILGVIHHWLYKKHQKPTWWGIMHRWFGRTIIVVGIVNGGLGLLLAENTKGGKIVYAAIAGVAGLVYLMVVVQWFFRTRAVRKTAEKQLKKKNYMEPEPYESARLMPS